MNATSAGSLITINAPSRERMMSSIPWRSGVPGAIRATAPSTSGSIRGSSSAALRGKPSGAAGLRPSLSVLGSVAIEPLADRPSQRVRFDNAKFATRRSRGCDDLLQAELRAFFDPPLGLRRGAKAAGQPELAEGGGRGPTLPVARR